MAERSDQPAPMLVLLPGLDGTGKLFSEILKALERRVATLIVDYPKDIPLGYDQLESLVRAALPDDRPFVLLGESFSGPLAIRIAAHPPPGLCGLILCVTFARNPYPWAAWAKPLAAYLPLKSFPRWLRAPLMWGSNDPNRAPSQSQRAMAGVSVEVVRRRIAALLAVDETPALRKVSQPVLVLRAMRDRVVPKSATERIMREAPHAELVDIDGPHLLLQTRPADCAAAIQSFMRELSNSKIPAEKRSGFQTAAAYPSGVPGNQALIMETKLQQLSVDERIKLVEDLWDSIAVDQGALPITTDQKTELDRRLDSYAVDKNRGRLAADAVRDIRRQL